MIEFKNRVLFVGFGAVARCSIPVLMDHVKIPTKNITIMDFDSNDEALRPWIEKGITFVKNRVTRENMGALLGQYVSKGDIIIDLAWNIDCCEILTWCHEHGVLYINTSVEVWDPYENAEKLHPTERTLYHRHMKLRKLIASWKQPSVTAVLEHGANPGLISHFTKHGLLDIASHALADKLFKGAQAELIAEHAKKQEFNHLAHQLGVKVIHCSERDTQITDQPKLVNEFYVNSWVPNYSIVGMVVRHGEAFSITEKLTVREGDKAIYRPTVHYAYCPCDAAIASLNELKSNRYNLQPKIRIMTDEITSGEDILGALIMGHPYKSWWCGSDLSIEESRRKVPHQNATTLQVAISVVAAFMWMIENPEKGVVLPDDLPHDFVLKISKPYLGKFISVASDWTPLRDYANAFNGYNKPEQDLSDPWQFKNFLINDGD
ncbi:homospermidine synthase [bacterium]|nr:homospermidine synthase [bacterium]